MKVRRCIPVLLLASVAFSLDTPAPQKTPSTGNAAAQSSARPASPAAPPRRAVRTPAVAPNTEVISINGLCPPSGKTRECKTTVTRAQFEQLLTVLPGERTTPIQQMSAAAKRQFAVQYSHLLAFAAEAEKRGLQNAPEGHELLQYARMQALAQMLTHQFQAETQPTQEEVKSYYVANQQRFVELTLQRVFIPVRQLANGKTNEAEMRDLADELHQRAATTNEFRELQAEVNERAEIKDPPDSRVVLPATALPSTQQEVVQQLKPGELSQVIHDPSGFFIYKLEAIRPLPLEAEAKQIQDELAESKVQQQVAKLLSSSKPALNQQYFQQGAGWSGRGSRATINDSPAARSWAGITCRHGTYKIGTNLLRVRTIS
jgi:PPIC-type PPIASE domain